MQKPPFKKAKLPRKRKKLAIKTQGRKWYYDTIKLHQITQESGRFDEPICKFWVNDSVRPLLVRKWPLGFKQFVPVPTRYW